MEQVSIKTGTGADLNAYWTAPERPRAIVQINHGLCEHAARYHPFMEKLAEAGFAAVAHDHRGHGHTTAPDAKLGVFSKSDGLRKVLEDTAFIQDWTTDKWMSTPLIVMGHSMGGLIAVNTAVAFSDRLHGLAVWNSNLAPGLLGRVGQVLVAGERAVRSYDAPCTTVSSLAFGAWDKAYAADAPRFGWLSRNPEIVAAYEEDPLCGFDASVSMWADVLKMSQCGEDTSALKKLSGRLPVQLIGGEKDPASDNGKAIHAFEKKLRDVGMSNIETHLFPNARHETLHEPEGPEVTALFVDWIERHI